MNKAGSNEDTYKLIKFSQVVQYSGLVLSLRSALELKEFTFRQATLEKL